MSLYSRSLVHLRWGQIGVNFWQSNYVDMRNCDAIIYFVTFSRFWKYGTKSLTEKIRYHE